MAHWTESLTTLEIAEQLMPACVLAVDYLEPPNNSWFLDTLQAFYDRIDDQHIIEALNVYMIPFWKNVPVTLTTEHFALIHELLDEWVG